MTFGFSGLHASGKGNGSHSQGELH